MKSGVIFNNQNTVSFIANDVLQVTALLYLKEALLNEEVEDCAELIKIAKEFGAVQFEINAVLCEYNYGKGDDVTDEVNLRF